jgi:regulation of enolase protein 1 (concanavalin A-like superfamily)
MDKVILGSVSDDSDLSGTWKALWDWENLYFLVEITDDVQYNDSPISTPWEDDVVELYIDADHSHGASYDNDYELIFRWNDPGVIHIGYYSESDTTNMDFVIVDTATGYRFEASLPWSTLGATPVGGNYIGLDVHTCDDDDGGNREAKKAWWAETDDSWQWPNIFASVILTGSSTAPVPPGQASNPSPTGTSVGINSDLSWTAGTNATSHDVYFGTDSTPDSGEFQDNQTETTFDPNTLDYDTTYYWRIDEKNAAGTTTGVVWSFTTTSAPGPLPSPWISYDIGSPGAAGSASYASGVFTVSGSGADIAGTSDAGQFVYQPASGDCTIIARVVSLTDVVANWAKAGIMIRESLNANSTFAFGNYTTNVSRSVNSWTLLHRDTTGSGASQTVWGSATPPYWLRVIRSGDNFYGYVSSNGSTWSFIDMVTIPMSSEVYIGMAVTSHQAGSLSTATFDNVSVTP